MGARPSSSPSLFSLALLALPALADVVFRQRVSFERVSFTKTLRFFNETNRNFEGGDIEYRVDILMLADYSMFENFVELSGGDEFAAFIAVSEYLSAIFHQTIYSKLHLRPPLSLSMVGKFVAERIEDCPLNELSPDPVFQLFNETDADGKDEREGNSTERAGLSALVGVNRLAKWLDFHADFLPPHDHAVLLTKVDLVSTSGDSATQGMAYVGAMCRGGESSSLVEDVGGMATAIVAAHELAHSLGAFHDGSSFSADCSPRLNFLMSPLASSAEDARFANSFRLSQCSLRLIHDFVLNDTQAVCLAKSVPRVEKRLHKKSSTDVDVLQPGETFSIHTQCQLAFDFHHGNREYARRGDPCRRIWCKDRRKRRFEPCVTKTYLPALDGTSCLGDKWCQLGTCVVNPRRKACRDLNTSVCSRFSKKKLRAYCRTEEFHSLCCATCTRLLVPTPVPNLHREL